ncbi:hypothetical protein [Caulobacter sp. 17J65-9]|uniref:hypothetical protein n=1 Tax=Caulobacter sp. 17J65-9 TaxID=2709382 RepID=UPI0013CD50D2|nr:hypothetical protein [Caulobacter sp. 17J65-9]NEX91938.1 hypothetical protein [Caulobacter sp. 17J65-9]
MIRRRSGSDDATDDNPPVPTAWREGWGRRLKQLGFIILIAFAYDEYKLARARQSGSDVSPGLRIAAARYRTPKGCSGANWNEGQRMPAACQRGYDIPDGEAWGYGLTPPAGGIHVRQHWFRAGDDAVLAYCGLLVGCKATLVVRGRFYDAWEPRG